MSEEQDKPQKIVRSAPVVKKRDLPPEVIEAELPKFPEPPPVQKPEIVPLEIPQPESLRRGQQFSLQRLEIRNIFTKVVRNMSIPKVGNPLDYFDKASEELVGRYEVKFWGSEQRDAELKAFKTLKDPTAGNDSPHATRPPSNAFINSAE